VLPAFRGIRLTARGSAYWEAVPFLSSETAWVEDWQQDLERQRRELSQLQSELTPGLRKKNPVTSQKFMVICYIAMENDGP